MSGPYRTPLFRLPSLEAFWQMLARRRRSSRALAFAGLGLLFLPGIAVASGSVLFPSVDKHNLLERGVINPSGKPWGLVVTPNGVEPLIGPLPHGVLRPDQEASPIPTAVLQSAIAAGVTDKLVGCYRDTLRDVPGLRGDAVAEIAIRDDHARTAFSFPHSFKYELDTCLEAAFDAVKFPQARGDVAWVHFPLRFVPAQ
jgi:hypothetical protein